MEQLLTPGNSKFILLVSVLSRLLVILIQLASNMSLADHEADAYKNKYYDNISNGSLTFQLVSPETQATYYALDGLTKWDSQYFIEISIDGYKSEPHMAFFPMFPLLVGLVRRFVFQDKSYSFNQFRNISSNDQDSTVTVADLESYIKSAAIGILVNNFILFPIACFALFALTRLAKSGDERYCKEVVLWFCFNPASIFFSAFYSESLFAALSFSAMLTIEARAITYQQKWGNQQQKDRTFKLYPLSQLNRMYYITLPGASLLLLATATRSNGMVHVGFFFYQLLLKYAEIYKSDTSNWSLLLYLTQALEFLQDLLVLTIDVIVSATGYISYQFLCYSLFCNKSQSSTKGSLNKIPPWCSSSFPNPYAYVQKKYWGVGFLTYYRVIKLPNFLLAFPMTYIILTGTRRISKEISRPNFNRKIPAYYIHSVMITMFCALVINVEVTTRIIASSCPALYWICADSKKHSRLLNTCLKFYFATYFIAGVILHSNFYPWV